MGFGIWETTQEEMNKKELEDRTRAFALSVIRFVSQLDRSPASDVLGRQLLKASTSIGANYTEANRAESRQDFHHKVAIAEKEAAETLYWLKLLQDAGIGESESRRLLLKECDELLAIFTVIGKRTRPGPFLSAREDEPDDFA